MMKKWHFALLVCFALAGCVGRIIAKTPQSPLNLYILVDSRIYESGEGDEFGKRNIIIPADATVRCDAVIYSQKSMGDIPFEIVRKGQIATFKEVRQFSGFSLWFGGRVKSEAQFFEVSINGKMKLVDASAFFCFDKLDESLLSPKPK